MIGDLLDSHLGALNKAGYVRTADRPGPEERLVRRALREAGFGDRDDLVEYLCWASLPEAGAGLLELFFETSDPFSYLDAIAFAAGLQEFVEENPDFPGSEVSWPGPSHWLPIAMLDSTEFISLDTRDDADGGGAVWFLVTDSENVRMFDSLVDAIRTATYCVEAGLWTVEDDGFSVECSSRSTVPSERDIANPPWHGYERS